MSHQTDFSPLVKNKRRHSTAVRLFVVLLRLLSVKLQPDCTWALQRDAFTAAQCTCMRLWLVPVFEEMTLLTSRGQQSLFISSLIYPLITWTSYQRCRRRGEDGGENKEKMLKVAEIMDTRATGWRSVTFLFLFLFPCTDWLSWTANQGHKPNDTAHRREGCISTA